MIRMPANPVRVPTHAAVLPPSTAVEAVEVPCEAPCPRAAAIPRRVPDVCPDAGARLALAIARYVAGARATGETDCIEAAFAEAEAALPPESAALLVGALAGLVRALEAHAGRPLAVLPASCCRATADEVALLAHVARARADGAGAAEGRVARTAAAAAALLGPAERPLACGRPS
ncbi:hypothetical protein [Salinarimonas rosea]|uniref:hypothetical protein n=1 Tax=Salinarimonas rosea TaxID=552063 RepID=UPI000403B7A3|nr:hypothetical protein [Salinarimonas rosea]